MNFVFALIGAFFKWIFLLPFAGRKTFREVLWGKEKPATMLDYDSSLSALGIGLVLLIIWILTELDVK